MKKAYQIEERRAIEKFRSHLMNDPGDIQMVLPLAEIAQKLREGVAPFLLQTQLQLLMLIMDDEVDWLTGKRYGRGEEKAVRRWGREDAAVVINGQKVPLRRPRLRGEEGERKLGSYELFSRDEDMQRRVWDRITRGLTMRGYGPVVRECEPAFGIEKSAVSERFVLASAQKVDALLKRKLHDLRFCAVLWDGVQYKEEHLVTALGIDSTGHKMILGFHQGASENQQVCEGLLADLVGRGLDLRQPHLNIIDGGKGLLAALRKYCGDAGLVQRCQLHKRRNVCGHFADEDQPRWDRKLANAYDLREYKEAKAALLRNPARADGNKSECSSQPGRRHGRNFNLASFTCSHGVVENTAEHQPDRIGILHRSRRVPKREAMAARPSDRTMGRFGIDRCGKTVPAHRWLSRPPRVDLFARRSTHWYRSQTQGRLRLIIGFGESSEF